MWTTIQSRGLCVIDFPKQKLKRADLWTGQGLVKALNLGLVKASNVHFNLTPCLIQQANNSTPNLEVKGINAHVYEHVWFLTIQTFKLFLYFLQRGSSLLLTIRMLTSQSKVTYESPSFGHHSIKLTSKAQHSKQKLTNYYELQNVPFWGHIGK